MLEMFDLYLEEFDLQVKLSPLRAFFSGSSNRSRFVLWFTCSTSCRRSDVKAGPPAKVIFGSFNTNLAAAYVLEAEEEEKFE